MIPWKTPLIRMGRRFILIASLVSLFMVQGCAQQFQTPLVQKNDITGWGASGMAWNGKALVVADDNLYMEAASVETGAYFGNADPYTNDGYYVMSKDPLSFPIPRKICGLAWEDQCCGRGFLWAADSARKELIKINEMNDIVLVIPSPGNSPNGLAYDGKTLWVADSERSKIFRVSPMDGAVIAEFNSPVREPSGLAWDFSGLWITGQSPCSPDTLGCSWPRLVRLDVLRGVVTHEIELSTHITKPSSLEWVDGVLWVGDYPTNRIFKITSAGREVADGTVYTSPITVAPKAPASQKPRHLTAASPSHADRTAGDARAAAEEAKDAARQAQKAAEDAKKAAAKSEKAFELQQKK